MRSGGIELLNLDCMEYMSTVPDKFFDLAIVDPPYGIKESSYRATPSKCAAPKKKYNTNLWKQDAPNENYFNELFRVSKQQIVWGGNYFANLLPNSRHWLVWDKVTDDSNFADCELAWTSFTKSIKKYTFAWNGMIQGDMKNKEVRIHPTQKPVALYKYILKNYANEGDKILDTHLGSGSIAIACHEFKFELTACEIDKTYYEAANKRYINHIAQTSLF